MLGAWNQPWPPNQDMARHQATQRLNPDMVCPSNLHQELCHHSITIRLHSKRHRNQDLTLMRVVETTCRSSVYFRTILFKYPQKKGDAVMQHRPFYIYEQPEGYNIP